LTSRGKLVRSISKNKNMPKQSVATNKKSFFSRFSGWNRSSVIAVLMIVLLIGGVMPRIVQAVTCNTAADCQAQISNLNNQNATASQSLNALQSQAASYQDVVDQLQSQISGLQSQIADNQAKQASLQEQITANEQEITAKKLTLSDDIKTMYVDGQMSTIEELATSKDLSDYVDKEQYRTTVQDQLNSIIQQIAALEQTLQGQKVQVDQLVSTEQVQDSQLANSESQQQGLLNYNQSQQGQYNQQITANGSNISQLKARLTALNTTSDSKVSFSGTCGGGYPSSATNQSGAHWGCSYPQDSSLDNWRMDNRECVSYTAFMVSTKYGISTSGWGDAYQWISAAESHGYTVDQTPSVGAIAIRDIDYSEPGDVGHAMYVEAVNGSDNITVDEYNENYNGTFDQRTFSPSSYDDRGGMYYIHFD
jgi:surface antigen/peptidoglycan hydrolase CwlO-like protein